MDPIKEIVEERGADYGHPYVNHNRTARLYNAYLASRGTTRATLTAHDVCMLNILQKISRSMHGSPSKDTLQDIAGYAMNAQIVEESRKAEDEQAKMMEPHPAFVDEDLQSTAKISKRTGQPRPSQFEPEEEEEPGGYDPRATMAFTPTDEDVANMTAGDKGC